jgi:pyruvate-ferredoxin/flavodoxin oxidoreductase
MKASGKASSHYIWAVDRKQRLSRVLVAKTIVESCEERRDFWIMLRGLAGVETEKVEVVDIESKVRAEVVGKITQGLMKLAGGNGEGIAEMVMTEPAAEAPQTESPQADGDYMAPWLESDECTACDECIKLNPNIFEYNMIIKLTSKIRMAGLTKTLSKLLKSVQPGSYTQVCRLIAAKRILISGSSAVRNLINFYCRLQAAGNKKKILRKCQF